MGKLRFMDIVVLSVMVRLAVEGQPPSQVVIMDAYNTDLETGDLAPFLKRRCVPIKSATNMTKIYTTLHDLGVLSEYALVSDKVENLTNEFKKRYGENFMNWPDEIPYDDQGNLQWSDAVSP